MAWLADLVDSSEGSLDVLPVQCLCEFLLHDAPEIFGAEDDKQVKKVCFFSFVYDITSYEWIKQRHVYLIVSWLVGWLVTL